MFAKRNTINSKPFCKCWDRKLPKEWNKLNASCSCGEESNDFEWKWHNVEVNSSAAVISDSDKQVTFHPVYSSGTGVVRGNTPLDRDQHYYWEIKMMTEAYGTDIMIGVGTDKVNPNSHQFEFTSLLGEDAESYGMSYRGTVRHNGTVADDSDGFCMGTIVGVRVDMWRGTLEYYLNRKPQGVLPFNLRRHKVLFPMISSTAAQSTLRLIYTSSWRASLLVDAAKTLASSILGSTVRIPPGLWYSLKNKFWMTLPSEVCVDEDEEMTEGNFRVCRARESVLQDVIPSQYMNGFYVDNVEANYRVVVWQ